MPRGFSYNAYALALGGAITSIHEDIPSVGAIVLSPSGGKGETLITDYKSPLGSVTASSILSKVSGGQRTDGRFAAEASVVITNLTVRDIQRSKEVFRADFLFARVSSVHELGGVDINPESSITFEAKINKLVAADEEIDARLDTTLCNEGDTFDRFVSKFPGHPDAADLVSHYGWTLPKDSDPAVPAAFRDAGMIPVTVMRRDARPSIAAPRHGFTITIPDKGLLHIGEAILKRGRRRLSLLRLELGAQRQPTGAKETANNLAVGANANVALEATDPPDSPEGSLSFACLEGNGTEIWP